MSSWQDLQASRDGLVAAATTTTTTTTTTTSSKTTKPSSGEMTSTEKVIRRSRNGCLTCRVRRVKCDETPTLCRNCQRLDLTCEWADGTISRASATTVTTTAPAAAIADEQSSGQAAGSKLVEDAATLAAEGSRRVRQISTRRLRRSRLLACEPCRIAKSRCSQEKPRCDRCRSAGVTCYYPEEQTLNADANPRKKVKVGGGKREKQRQQQQQQRETEEQRPSKISHPVLSTMAIEPPPPPSSAAALPTLTSDADLTADFVLGQHLDAFFTCVYPVHCHDFLHRRRLERDIQAGTASDLLLMTLCGVAARHMNLEMGVIPEGNHQAAIWIKQARAEVMAGINDFSIERLACVVLLGDHGRACNEFGVSWIYSAIAHRLALGLHLEDTAESPSLNAVEREMRIRLVWAIWRADVFNADGLDDYLSFRHRKPNLPLPITEEAYRNELTVETPRLQELDGRAKVGRLPSEPSIAACLLALYSLRAEILSYTKQMTDRDVLPPWRRGSHFQKLEERLQRFQADLPTRLRFDRDTLLELYAENRGQLTPFIHMHVWISQLFCDLYRSTMPGLENAAPPSYLADSPPGWSEFIARLCFESAQQIARKLGMVDRLFPDFIHRDDIIAINVFESVRNQIGHVFALDPLAQDVEAWDEIRADVVPMMRFVRRTLPIHYSARSTYRQTLALLERHDIDLGPSFAIDPRLFPDDALDSVGEWVVEENYTLRQMRLQGSAARAAGNGDGSTTEGAGAGGIVATGLPFAQTMNNMAAGSRMGLSQNISLPTSNSTFLQNPPSTDPDLLGINETEPSSFMANRIAPPIDLRRAAVIPLGSLATTTNVNVEMAAQANVGDAMMGMNQSRFGSASDSGEESDEDEVDELATESGSDDGDESGSSHRSTHDRLRPQSPGGPARSPRDTYNQRVGADILADRQDSLQDQRRPPPDRSYSHPEQRGVYATGYYDSAAAGASTFPAGAGANAPFRSRSRSRSPRSRSMMQPPHDDHDTVTSRFNRQYSPPSAVTAADIRRPSSTGATAATGLGPIWGNFEAPTQHARVQASYSGGDDRMGR